MFETLGGIPIAVPFPDVPLALSQGNLDAIQSTHETIRSAKLWDAGLTYCFEDNANLIQYYPIISRQAYDRLSESQRDMVERAWKDAASDSREASIRFQASAREELLASGVQCSAIDPRDVSSFRDVLNEQSLALATSIGMDQSIVDLVMRHYSNNGEEFRR